MRTSLQLAAAALAALAGLAAASAAAPSERRAGAAARPVVSKLSPSSLVSGARLTVRGRNFAPGRRRNRVVFLGGRGRRDDVTVRATVAKRRTIVLRSSGRPASGRLRVVNRFGASRPSRARVTFDDDRDGLSNERERKLGTNPRKRDTDGDGLRDGVDLDPLHPPPAGGPPDGGGGGGTPAVPSECPAAAAAGSASGPASSFEGLENVIQEGRARIGHSAYTDAPVGAYCLYRKRLGDPDSAYQLVGRDTGAEAGVIRDGQRPFKSEDYVYRTDAVTAAGMVVGSDTVGARGAGSIANVDGWAQINQSCTACGSAAVQTGALKAAAAGAGGAGPPVGQVAVYSRRLALEPVSGAEWVARVLTPQTPSEPGTYASANLTISDEHPATARGASSVADVTDSNRPFINVELRAQADGELRVVVTESGGFTATYPTDLRSFGVIDNTYLVVQPLPGGTYEVRFKTNMNPGDADIVVFSGRDIPGGMTSGWLSLRAEVSSEEAAEHDARFDEVFVTGQPAQNLDEQFGGTALNIQVPAGFDAQPVATGLTAPTAVEFAPNGDMYISERRGTVKRRDAGTGTISQVLDISPSVNAPVFVDQGLLGFALDPGFDGDGDSDDYAYLSYTVAQGPGVTRTVARVERVRFDGGTQEFDPATRTVLVGADDPAAGSGDTCPPAATSDCLPSDAYTHSAGGLAFGSDGKLWISVPDGASPEGPGENGKDPLALRAQNVNSLAGKLLRVEPSTGAGVADNPGFQAGAPDSPASRTWVTGFRNPFRLAQRPGGTQAFYITDVGWGAFEELNVVPSGLAPPNANYGWPCREGFFESDYTGSDTEPYESACPDTLPGKHDPLFAYDSSGVDRAIIGSAFYTGGLWPAPWTPPAGGAAFFYSDYPSGEITRLQTDANDAMTDLDVFASGFSGPVDVSEGPADFAAPSGATALYIVNIGDVGDLSATDGRVWRITGP